MTSMMMCSVAVSMPSLRPMNRALYQVMAAQVVEGGWGSKHRSAPRYYQLPTSMAPMTVPMGIWSVSCNWCVVIVVITGQS